MFKRKYAYIEYMLYLYLFLANVLLSYSFNPLNKPSLYQSYNIKKKIKDDSILDKLKNNDDIEPSNILFFTSVSNSIPGFVYDDFLKSLSEKYHNNILIPKEKEDIKKLPSDSSLTVISHASGAIEALKYAKNKKVKNLVLIDPVDNRIEKITGKKSVTSIESFWDENEDPLFNLENVEKALFLYTKKSYKWEDDSTLFGWAFNPLSGLKTLWPSFIPEKLSIKPKDLITSEYKGDCLDYDCCDENECACDPEDSKLALKILNYGLCDILDFDYSNFMHNSFCEGHPDRGEENIIGYHKQIALLINLFLKHKYSDYKEYLDDLDDFKKIEKI